MSDNADELWLPNFYYDSLLVEAENHLDQHVRIHGLDDLKRRFRSTLSDEARDRITTPRKLLEELENDGKLGLRDTEILKVLAKELKLTELEEKVCEYQLYRNGRIWGTIKGAAQSTVISLKNVLQTKETKVLIGGAVVIGLFHKRPDILEAVQGVLPVAMQIVGVNEGSICFMIETSCLSSLRKLWEMYKDGSLCESLETVFNTIPELQELSNGEGILVEVCLNEQENHNAWRKLAISHAKDLQMFLEEQQQAHYTAFTNMEEQMTEIQKKNKEFASKASNLSKDLQKFLEEQQKAGDTIITKMLEEVSGLQENIELGQQIMESTTITPSDLHRGYHDDTEGTDNKSPAEHSEPITDDLVCDVKIIDLKDFYDKVQSRRASRAEMRIEHGVVNIEITTTAQISKISVYVRRCKKAAEKTNDTIGPVELPVHYSTCEGQSQTKLWVDLDAVYNTHTGSPVYRLDRVEIKERNLWELLIYTEFIDGTKKITHSKSFWIRIKPRPRLRDDTSLEPDQDPYQQQWKRLRTSPPSSVSSGVETMSLWDDKDDERNPFLQAYQSIDHDSLRVKYLEAEKANITELRIARLITSVNADVAYRFKLKDLPHGQAYDEGDIMGFFEDENGKTVIDLLDSKNAREAFLAGVISRSAYIEVKQSLCKETSDIVCVNGVVKVKCIGSVRAGERIYSALDVNMPGTAIAEGHLPPGAVLNNRGTLLGMALEEKCPKKIGEVLLVKSFVCIALGITDNKIAMEVENMYDRVGMLLNERLKKERKRVRKEVLCATFSFLVFLLLGLSMIASELFFPGSDVQTFHYKTIFTEGNNLTGISPTR